MGYDETWFESQPVSEEFKCPICQEVFQDPVTAVHCEHVFCEACIQQCFGTSSYSDFEINCPICREPINFSDLKPTIRIFRSLLDKHRIRCQFKCCTKVTELQHFESHRLDCDQNPDNQPKPCPEKCGAIVTRFEKATHNCIQYLQAQMNSLTIEMNKLQMENEQLRTETFLKKVRKFFNQFQKSQ